MTTPTLAPMIAVSEYARRVRAHLADLAPDDVTELTEGMEADLVEALLEIPGGDAETLPTIEQVEARFGPAADYAAELRAAAGLPSATPSGTKRSGVHGIPGQVRGAAARLRARKQKASRDVQDRLESQSWWPGIRELAVTMRPVWWVVRGYSLAMIGQPWGEGALPTSAGRWLALLGLVALSVQWGRGRLGGQPWVRRVGLVASAVAVVVLPFVLASVSEPRYVQVETWVGQPSDVSGPGVFMDGEQVRSFHAFDPQGEPIEEFLLFDDHGRPVITVPLANEEFFVGGSEELWHAVPPLDVYGKAVWNSYPLQLGRWNWLTWDPGTSRWAPLPASEGSLVTPIRPFERAIPLEAAVATGDIDTDEGATSEEGEDARQEADDAPAADGQVPADKTADETADGPDGSDGSDGSDGDPGGDPSPED